MPSTKDDETKLDLTEAKLAGVVKRMLETPPQPHKPAKPLDSGQKSTKSLPDHKAPKPSGQERDG